MRVALMVLGLSFTPFLGHAATPAALDVADAFTEEQPVQVRVSLRYGFQRIRTKLSREFLCAREPGRCGSGQGLVFARELDATRTRHTLILDAAVGLYRDLELRVEVPVVLTDRTDLVFAPGVGARTSLLAGTLLDAPRTGIDRSGIGDLTVAIRYAPVHHERAESEAALVFELAYTPPVASVIRSDNDAVGEGMHKLRLALDTGYPVLPWLEPWVGVAGTLRLAGDDTLYRSGFRTQELDRPGAQLEMHGGLVFIPWSGPHDDRAFFLSVGGRIRYTAEGREPTLLFEALGQSPCNADPDCDRTAYPGTRGLPGGPFSTNGVTDVQANLRFAGELEARYRPIPFLDIFARVEIAYAPSYFLTYALAGTDLDRDGEIDEVNASGETEFNPVYAPGLDELGQRIQATSTFEVGVQVGVGGRF